MQTLMVVEDETPIALVLRAYLEKAGFSTYIAADGEEALLKFSEINPSLLLLDLMLPGQDGLSVLEKIRKTSTCPVIVITARGAVKDRLQGFHLGADDYIAKPFDPDEVVARVKAVLRRPARIVEADLVQFGHLTVDFTSCNAVLKGRNISLARRDWDLLSFLVRHPNQVFSRTQLLDYVWGIDYDGGDRAVDVAVKRLRQALKDWPSSEGEIATVRGTGYMLSVKQK
ncbi:two component transcriptional regulator, winged helix family [Desulfofarcimen acetoxidans DSM 771]|jgi:DNA-binding response OmpR family regulator|uniref:Stage 0 sporulation protein A homolog n=1 Tax=Desulfofarcimen acetoxidans (strain ATCC 49208 / DSM 771 / KCTC 5769 / VKM B-1644 / 5575) TaxID=485916 RepID=C8VYH6_DESAS|nr:response regulator transcription factor [Desulfofarcimen acetoxidans]ACV62857.1 two component transcriptional regulator, winged helix family [Desulfofarcimen acetoxidans DSM 771]